jgi:hypothetical protein
MNEQAEDLAGQVAAPGGRRASRRGDHPVSMMTTGPAPGTYIVVPNIDEWACTRTLIVARSAYRAVSSPWRAETTMLP